MRYVQGIDRRLAKLPEAPGKDHRRMVEVRAVEAYYQQLLGALAPSQMTPRVVAAGWMIEELRISLFAESLGVRTPVSAKRVNREIAALFAGELD